VSRIPDFPSTAICATWPQYQFAFAPELLSQPPIDWLPSDNAGVARAQAGDLEQFHGLKAVIGVSSSDGMIAATSPQWDFMMTYWLAVFPGCDVFVYAHKRFTILRVFMGLDWSLV
jgi:hypothetical protein